MSLSDPLVGTQLGDYRIMDILGRGGMAHVYRGYDHRLQRYAAVKVIDADLLAKENESEYRQRFQREARAIARLNHPNIVGVYQFGEAGALYYMAMAFVEGRDLAQILRERPDTLLSPDQILSIVRDIGAALDYAHANGVIHRDIKPSNIMVTLDNHAILTDFGLALSVPEGTLGNTFGSAHYIAPEQAISSANAVPQSDLYSLGVVLYQMLTGKVPFDDPSAMSVALKHLSEPPPPPRAINPAISPAVERVVLKAIEKEPSKRYPTGAQMAQALAEAFKSGASSRTFPMIPFHKAEPVGEQTLQFSDLEIAASLMRAHKPGRSRRRWVLVGGLIAAILLVSGFYAWFMTRDSTSDAQPSATAIAALVQTAAAPTVTAAKTHAPAAITVTSAAAPSTDTRAPVQLIYDSDKLVLIDRADHPVSVRGWTFQRQAAIGLISFDALQWKATNLSAIQPNTCLLLWRISLGELPTPDYCAARDAWFAVGTLSRFWISDQPDAHFNVYGESGVLLATCPVNSGTCDVMADG